MNGKNTHLSDIVAEKDALIIERELDDFSNGAQLDNDTAQKILSSVMRKAGIKMDKQNVKITKKRSRRFIGLAAAAVIAVTGAVGAGAAYVIHKYNASDRYYGDGTQQTLEEKGALSEKTFKGEHFEVDIDSVISDGRLLSVTASAKPTDDEGTKLLEEGNELTLHSSIAEISPTESDEAVNFMYENGVYVMRWSYELDEPKDSVTIPMSVDIIGMEPVSRPVIEFELEFVKNLETITLESKDGSIITLSDNAVYGEDVTVLPATDPLPFREVTAIYDDGTEKKLNIFSENPDVTEDGHYDNINVTFNDLVDITKVSALTIGSTRFEVKK